MPGPLKRGLAHGRWARSRASIVALLLTVSAYASEPDQSRLLEVIVNGQPTGKIAQFTLHEGVLLTTPSELRDLRIRGPIALHLRPTTMHPGEGSKNEELISLSDLPGLSWRLDDKTETLYVIAQNENLLSSVLSNDEKPSEQQRVSIDSGTGLTLNYDIAGTAVGHAIGSSSSLDLRFFSVNGVASSGFLVFTGSGVGSLAGLGAAKNHAVRLDTAYTFADVGSLRRYSIGDYVTGGLSWTRPIRLAGLQVRSDFSMRPDLITFPLPSVTGSAAVPSTVDVLANGNQVLSQSVSAGPFEIQQLPVINGASSISMTVTNALGQQVTVTQPFYASVSLLAPSLQTFSAQAGLVRRQWGVLSNEFGKPAGLVDYRRGLTRAFTIEGSVEATAGTAMAGGGAVLRVGSFGILNASAAASAGAGLDGAEWSLGFQRISTLFSFGASELLSTRSFQDVAAINGDAVQRKQLSVNSGLYLGRLGSLGVAYAAIKQDAALHPVYLYSSAALNEQIVTASYSLQLRRMSLYANEFRSLTGTGNSGLQVGMTFPLGKRSSIDVSGGTAPGSGQVQAQKSAAEIKQWGYDAYISAAEGGHGFAQLQYRSPWSLFTAGVDQSGGQSTFRTESQGAISFVDRAFFLSNTIYDSFAIVDTGGLQNVRVLQENRDVGSTDKRGRLLVPDLRSFDLNHLGINPIDVPLDTTIDTATRAIRPQDRSGVIVHFPVKISHAALVRLVDHAGTPIPVGSSAMLRASHALFPVGYGGETYIDNLGPFNELDVELPTGHGCAASFLYLPVKGSIPTIGPLACL